MVQGFLISRSAPTAVPIWATSGLRQVPDSAAIAVIVSPDNLAVDRGSRFREGGIKGDHEVLIDNTRCMTNGLAATDLTSTNGEANSLIGLFLNNILWLPRTENTPISPPKGAECELKNCELKDFDNKTKAAPPIAPKKPATQLAVAPISFLELRKNIQINVGMKNIKCFVSNVLESQTIMKRTARAKRLA